jgi:hypothetical protein
MDKVLKLFFQQNDSDSHSPNIFNKGQDPTVKAANLKILFGVIYKFF